MAFYWLPHEPGPKTFRQHFPLDWATEEWHAVALVVLGLGFLAASLFVWEEMRYVIWGRTVEAEVNRTWQSEHNGRTEYFVEFSYMGDGGPTSLTDSVNEESLVPRSGTVEVQYLPGQPGSARLAVNHEPLFYPAIAFLIVCLALLTYFAITWWREAKASVRYLKQYRP